MSSFRFLALPPELRDYIYGDILTTTYFVKLPQQQVSLNARGCGKAIPQKPISSRLAILQVSKAVYHEAKQILCKHSVFFFDFPSNSLP